MIARRCDCGPQLEDSLPVTTTRSGRSGSIAYDTRALRPTQRPLTSVTRFTTTRPSGNGWIARSMPWPSSDGRIVNSDDCQFTSSASGSTL